MRKLLRNLKVIQTVSNKDRDPMLGRRYMNANRINPYNPLSYIVVIIGGILVILAYGFIGCKDQIDGNPFKWD